MNKAKKHQVEFKAHKKVKQPVKVKFKTKDGDFRPSLLHADSFFDAFFGLPLSTA